MKYIKEFRNQHVVKHLASAIHAEALPHRVYPLMEFCGGHTHGLFRYGLQELVPKNVEFIHGPGCPVCVLPGGRIDSAIEIIDPLLKAHLDRVASGRINRSIDILHHQTRCDSSFGRVEVDPVVPS